MTDRIRQALALAFVVAIAVPPAAHAQARGGASNYACEGQMANVATVTTSTNRSEWPINFRMSVNRSTGSVMIFAVSGTTVIKPGRYAIASDGQGRMALSWKWIDQANNAQPVVMTVARSGEFEGSWSQTSPSAQLEALAGIFLGPEASNMVKMSTQGSFSGVCWQ